MKNNLLCRVQTDLIQAWTKELINNISLTIHTQERIGLIGENGSWKTTLMNYIKDNQPWVSLVWSLAYGVQEISHALLGLSVREYLSDTLPEWTHYTMYEPLENRDIDPMTLLSNLSWWQRKRISLLSVTLSQADIWLFDEPTNHLDSIGKEWLTDMIVQHTWWVLCVSHDRSFLDTISTCIWSIHEKIITSYPGNYSNYLVLRKAEKERQQLEHDTRKKKKDKMEKMVARIRQDAHNKDDPALWRLLKSKEKMLEREVIKKEVQAPPEETQYSYLASWQVHNHKKILTINNLSVWHSGQTPLFVVPKAEVYGKQKIRIIWQNWSWKSTLLHLLHREKDRQDKTLWWWDMSHYLIDQHIFETVSGTQTLFDYVYNETRFHHGEIYWYLLSYGFEKADFDRRIENLSFWQKMRLTLAIVLLKNYDVLFLDEPTNHLDIPTRQSLEDMLAEFWWTVFYVTHDQWFADSVWADQVWEIKGGKMSVKEENTQ